MFSLAWPWMLLALPLPFVLRTLLPEANQLQEAGLRVPSFAGFDVLSDRSRVEQLLNWRIWVAMVAWVLLVVAAARPERVGEELEVPVSGRNLMLAVDLSGSMDQKDFELGSRRVDRLTATKAVASDFISRREGDRIGLILFGERAYLQVPLTLDRETVKILLMEAFIGLAGEKTAIGDAITLAVKRIHDQEEDAGEQVLVLLTDGANTAGEIDPMKAAELAAQVGLARGRTRQHVRRERGIDDFLPAAGAETAPRQQDRGGHHRGYRPQPLGPEKMKVSRHKSALR